MSIPHLDDLSGSEILRIVDSLSSSTTTIKYDGANLWFGVDELGVFVTREGKNKSAGRIYTPGDFENVAPNDQFKATLQALQSVKSKISEVLDPSDLIEIEVIFGIQPNVVVFHNSENEAKIMFIRGINTTTHETVVKLGEALLTSKIEVEADLHTSTDGIALETTKLPVTFTFEAVPRFQTSKILNLSEIQPLVDELRTALNSPSDIGGVTVGELEQMKTTDSNKREKISGKISLDRHKKNLKMAIYQKLTSFFKNEANVEGFVISVNDRMVKIVNTDYFIPVKDFFQKGRKSAIGAVLTIDPSSDMDKRGGIVGMTLIQMASILGKPEFARAQAVRNSMNELGAEQFLKQFKITDITSIKNRLIGALNNGIKLLSINNSRFQSTKGGSINLGGETITYSTPVINKTNIASAEALQKLNQMKVDVTAATTIEDVVAVVFGRFVSLNRKVEEGLNMIAYMLLEDESVPPTAPTTAGDVAAKDTVVGATASGSRYKFVVRKRNDSVLQAIKKQKLNIKKD